MLEPGHSPEPMPSAVNATDEQTNAIMTVSRLQIALKTRDRSLPANSLQADLNEITLNTATDTAAGLFHLLQQVVALVLEHSQLWSHFQASSQTVATPIAAEELFNQFSLSDRAKFSVETLTNVDGVVTQTEAPIALELEANLDDQPGYLVITLLLGTADDQPLFGEVLTAATLKAALQALTTMNQAYLLVLEVLWTPQTSNEVLTLEDLAADFGDLLAIA